MAEDFDVEEMLEAPFHPNKDSSDRLHEHAEKRRPSRKEIDGTERGSGDTREKGRDRERDRDGKHHKRRSRSRSRSKERKHRDKDEHDENLIKRERSKSRGRDKDRKRDSSKDRDKHRDKDKDKHRRRSRSVSKSKEKSHRHRTRSRSKERSSRHRDDRRRSRSRSRDRYRDRRSPYKERRFNGRRYRSRSRSSHRDMLPPEERDQRTVFCMQLAARVTQRDLEEFFSSVGKVREARLILDNKTRRHKGIAYVEFVDAESVPLALALAGQKLCGIPIIIQQTQAEKNRAAASSTSVQRGLSGPMKLYVGSLHFNITEDMLRGIFEPFGRIDKIELMRDETGRSKGFGFITFHDAEDAKKALEQLNGFELAGRPMKVNHVTERQHDLSLGAGSALDNDDSERPGFDLGTTGRLHLMAKLAEGTGIKLPQATLTALKVGSAGLPLMNSAPQVSASSALPTPISMAPTNNLANGINGASTSVTAGQTALPLVATQCFVLTNMFDPQKETDPDWPEQIRNDVLEECKRHGGALHIFVDKGSAGNVYVKCPTIKSATEAVTALHGRWFAGRLITAAYVPVASYHALFPDAAAATNLL